MCVGRLEEYDDAIMSNLCGQTFFEIIPCAGSNSFSQSQVHVHTTKYDFFKIASGSKCTEHHAKA